MKHNNVDTDVAHDLRTKVALKKYHQIKRELIVQQI